MTSITLRMAALLACLFVALQSAGQTPREQAVAGASVGPVIEGAARLERLTGGLQRPWSLAFLPDGDILVTEKHRGLRVIRDGRLLPDIVAGGPPGVFAKADSGLLEVLLDPEFERNRRVYLSFAEGDETANRTAVWSARYVDGSLRDGHVIFRAQPDKKGAGHPGGRMIFLPDATLLLTIGDGYEYKAAAQDLGSHLGKIVRLARDGATPADNPFVGRVGVLPEIWTLGHRNVQGLARDPVTGIVWAHEHGPRGGDEINRLKAGANYGWPIVTHGIDYDLSIISERAFAPGIERSWFFWAPSIAPSGLALYRGQAFAEWDGKLLVGGLASKSVSRLRPARETGFFIEEERMFGSRGKRIRDVRVGPDGLVYLLTDEDDAELLRLRPAH
ncbi:MAG TPA: PQQ-dependent sugar dehydrogenase [Steroidobacteraceae bacterium]|jgi:glucose/arabinose dehydrogenase